VGVHRVAARRRSDGVLNESWRVVPSSITGSAPVAETEAEGFAGHGSEGVTLRLGQFYGGDRFHPGPPSAYGRATATDGDHECGVA
jgi:hypothetical protein